MQTFFCTGDYGKAYPVKQFAIRSSEPGPSANIEQRNPHYSHEIQIKPITQKSTDKANFVPGSYLKPDQHAKFMESTRIRLALTENLGRNKPINVSSDSAYNKSVKINPG